MNAASGCGRCICAYVRTAYIQMCSWSYKTSHHASNKPPLSARTCSNLVIENKSHPASDETPLSSKSGHKTG